MVDAKALNGQARLRCRTCRLPIGSKSVSNRARTDFCNCYPWEGSFCLLHCESRWSDRSRPCPSAAFFQRSRAASRLELGFAGIGEGLISPISTLSASLLLFLGELSDRAIGRPLDGCNSVAGVEVRCRPERRSRAA